MTQPEEIASNVTHHEEVTPEVHTPIQVAADMLKAYSPAQHALGVNMPTYPEDVIAEVHDLTQTEVVFSEMTIPSKVAADTTGAYPVHPTAQTMEAHLPTRPGAVKDEM